jgi:hypothetical protein
MWEGVLSHSLLLPFFFLLITQLVDGGYSFEMLQKVLEIQPTTTTDMRYHLPKGDIKELYNMLFVLRNHLK